MKAARVTAAGSVLRIVELEIPTPEPGQVHIQVHACGVCRNDANIFEGLRPGISYPRVQAMKWRELWMPWELE